MTIGSLLPLNPNIMNPKKDSAAADENKDATPEVSEAELLKQKKEEAKEKKATEKEEKKAAKAERKKAPQKAGKVKKIQKRNPLKIHSKAWRASTEKINPEKLYSLEEAVKLVQETSTVKFDASVEIHTRLGIDPKKSDQAVRASVSLPNGTGKTLRVVAFVSEDKAAAAKKAGAVEAGEENLIEKIGKGWLDFDVAVATPDMMKKLGKIAKTLGQKGLMPNPKAGTVTPDVEKAIEEVQKGKVEFRADSYGILHNTVGKISFTGDKLIENIKTYLKAVQEVKPKTVKSNYVKGISLASSMGPGVKIDANEIIKNI
jgi:large subunit ribosomal protein L1